MKFISHHTHIHTVELQYTHTHIYAQHITATKSNTHAHPQREIQRARERNIHGEIGFIVFVGIKRRKIKRKHMTTAHTIYIEKMRRSRRGEKKVEKRKKSN